MKSLLTKAAGTLIPPLFIFGLIFGGGYQVGASDIQTEWNDEKLKNQIILAKALEKNNELAAKAETAQKQIELINREHHDQITKIRRMAADDLNNRLRRDSARTCSNTVPKAPGTAGGRNKTGRPRAVVFSEAMAKRLEQRHQKADEITESLRACRAYVESLKDYRQ